MRKISIRDTYDNNILMDIDDRKYQLKGENEEIEDIGEDVLHLR